MGNEPTKHHTYLSANSLLLKQDDDKKTPSIKNILILFNVVLLVIVSVSLLWLAFGNNPDKDRFAATVVPENGFSFSVEFYKNASVQASRDHNYLIMRDSGGQEVSIWATEVDAPLGCGTKPGLDYTPQRDTTILSGCYEEDRKTYATAVKADKRAYQINMTAKKPISTEDARQIFGSIVIIQK